MKKEEVKEELYLFSKTIKKCFLFKDYNELSKRNWKNASAFLTSFLILFLIITFIIMLPKLFAVPNLVNSEMSKFSEFKLDSTISMTEPILMPQNNPYLVIDTTNTYNNSKILINQNGITLDGIFGEKVMSLTQYEDLVDAKSELGNLLFILLLLLIPGLFIALFIISLLKLLMTIFISTLIIYLILKIAKYRLLFKYLFISGVYASFMLIIFEFIGFIFALNLYSIYYIIYFIFHLLIAFNISNKRF